MTQIENSCDQWAHLITGLIVNAFTTPGIQTIEELKDFIGEDGYRTVVNLGGFDSMRKLGPETIYNLVPFICKNTYYSLYRKVKYSSETSNAETARAS